MVDFFLLNNTQPAFLEPFLNKSYLANDSLSNSYESENAFEEDLDNDLMIHYFLLTITILWILIASVGVMANLIVICVMVCGTKLTSATQYFIINLAISDLLFLIICPTLALINLHRVIISNHFPEFLVKILCKLDFFSSHMIVFITCLTLMSMTFDRYLVIMHPLKSMTYRTKSRAISINVIIWIVSITLSIPHGYYRVLEKSNVDNSSFCTNSKVLEETKINLYFTIIDLDLFNSLYTILIAYIIPFTSIVICYIIMINKLRKEKPILNESKRNVCNELHKRRRILMMIVMVTVLFGFNWLPIHCFHLAMKLYKDFPFASPSLFVFKTFTHTLPYLNSMLNPFFYSIVGNNFKKQVSAQKIKYSSRLKSFYNRGNNQFNHMNSGANHTHNIHHYYPTSSPSSHYNSHNNLNSIQSSSNRLSANNHLMNNSELLIAKHELAPLTKCSEL